MKLVDFSQIMRFLTDTVEYSLDVNYKVNEAKAPKNLYQQFYVIVAITKHLCGII